MSIKLRRFTEAVYSFEAVVMRTAQDQWDLPTPCDGWDARALLQHQCAVLNGVSAVAETGQMAKPTPPADMSDPQAVWADTRERVLASLDRQGALAQTGPFWFGAETVDDMIGIVTWDPVTHSWDLAQATGQQVLLSDALVQAAHDVVAPRSDMLVESGRTGPVIEMAADAPLLDRYLALVGRSA